MLLCLILWSSALQPMRQGRLARDDFGILVYHMDVIAQNFTMNQTSVYVPHGTWLYNGLQYLMGIETTIMGANAPAIWGKIVDANQIIVGDRSVTTHFVVGHVFQHGDMIWDDLLIEEDCTCNGLLMARDRMEKGSILGQFSTPFARAACRTGHAYLGAMGADTDIVSVDFKELSGAEASESTPLLSA
jgi:hypothetical protein